MTPAFKALLAVLAVATSASASAQTTPVQDASVNDLIALLTPSAGSSTKAFRPTKPPDAANRCAGQVSAGNAADTKTLVVEYADDEAPQVQLALRFDVSSDQLSASDRTLLQKLATALNSPQLRAERYAVAGHTDRSGNPNINAPLSCARSLRAKEFLVSRGVSANRLTAYGFGSQRLLAGFGANAAEHRRVELRLAQ